MADNTVAQGPSVKNTDQSQQQVNVSSELKDLIKYIVCNCEENLHKLEDDENPKQLKGGDKPKQLGDGSDKDNNKLSNEELKQLTSGTNISFATKNSQKQIEGIFKGFKKDKNGKLTLSIILYKDNDGNKKTIDVPNSYLRKPSMKQLSSNNESDNKKRDIEDKKNIVKKRMTSDNKLKFENAINNCKENKQKYQKVYLNWKNRGEEILKYNGTNYGDIEKKYNEFNAFYNKLKNILTNKCGVDLSTMVENRVVKNYDEFLYEFIQPDLSKPARAARDKVDLTLTKRDEKGEKSDKDKIKDVNTQMDDFKNKKTEIENKLKEIEDDKIEDLDVMKKDLDTISNSMNSLSSKMK